MSSTVIAESNAANLPSMFENVEDDLVPVLCGGGGGLSSRPLTQLVAALQY